VVFNQGWRQHIEDRQTSLETSVNELRGDVGAIGGKIDKLVEGMSSTDGRAAERAQAVKVEMRDETERKSKERTSLLMAAFGMLSAISIVVAAFCGPYVSQINSTAHGQQDDTFRIGQVRETIAGLGANQGQMQNDDKARDAELREHDQDLAFMKGAMAAKGWPTR